MADLDDDELLDALGMPVRRARVRRCEPSAARR